MGQRNAAVTTVIQLMH